MPVLLIGLLIAFLIETTVTTVPIVLLCILIFAVATKDTVVFTIAFVAGILLDMMSVRSVGITPLFFTAFFLLAFLYDRKYEIATMTFVIFAAFGGTYVYCLLFGYEHALLQAVTGAGVSAVAFFIVKKYSLARQAKSY